LDMLGERFTQARLKLDLQGIDIAAIRELQDSAKQMQADLLSRKVDPLVLQVQMLGLYSQLLQNGLDLKLEQLELQGDGGSLQGGGSLHLPEHPFSGAPGINLQQLKADFYLDVDHSIFASGVRLLDKLQHQGQASVNPAVLNEQAEQLAGALLQKGVFTRRAEGGYRIELAFDQGQGRLNGQPFKP